MSEEQYISDGENNFEVILDGDQPDDVEDQVEVDNNTNDNQENVDDESKKTVKPKRVVRNPQPKLNAQTLQGPKGLAAIEGYFQRVKFKGRGFEEQDLNVLLKTYEYWCHRLFPKFPFDNCIERLENLGTKRATQTQIKRIRMGLNLEDHENNIAREEEQMIVDEEEATGFVDTYNDQFDELTSTTTTTQPEPEISEEQLERMRANMEKAKRLREERLKKIGQNTQSLSEVSNQIHTQDSQFDTSYATTGENGQSSIWKDTQNMDSQMDIQQSENCQVNSNNSASGDVQNIVGEPQEFNHTESSGSAKQMEDNEDDIDNILDFINTEDPSEKDKQMSNCQEVTLDKDGSDRFASIQTEYSKISNDSRTVEEIKNYNEY